MKPIVETPRLKIRRFTEADREDFLKIERDERLTKYIHKRSPEESEKLFNSVLDSYDRRMDLGRWGAFTRDSGELVGICLLAPSQYDPSFIELGYRLHLKFWGQGLASEIAKALVDYGLNSLQLEEIAAVIDPRNKASEKVLLKAGFREQGEVFWYNEILPFFRIKKWEDGN